MNKLFQILILLLVLPTSFFNCNQVENTESTDNTLEKTTSRNWAKDLQNAASFTEETTLLKQLIQVDSINTHQQLIANRLQTFDLRHLSSSEKLTIIGLYETSLAPKKNPSFNVLQTASAKLNAAYPTDDESINVAISKVIALIKKQDKANLE